MRVDIVLYDTTRTITLVEHQSRWVRRNTKGGIVSTGRHIDHVRDAHRVLVVLGVELQVKIVESDATSHNPYLEALADLRA